MSAVPAVQLCAAVGAVGIIVDAAEMTSARAEISRRFSWQVLRTTLCPPATAQPVRMIVGILAAPRAGIAFQCLRASAAATSAGAWAAGAASTAAFCAAGVVLAQCLSTARLGFGLDGADQMQTVVWAGLALAGISPTAGLVLISGQSLLSYWVSGVAKIAGPEWRAGRAPGRIAATVAHGTPRAAQLLTRWSRPAAAATILFEVAGPFLVFTGSLGGTAFVMSAIVFHLAVAASMGLNNFVWAFGAALPAVHWLSTAMPWS